MSDQESSSTKTEKMEDESIIKNDDDDETSTNAINNDDGDDDDGKLSTPMATDESKPSPMVDDEEMKSPTIECPTDSATIPIPISSPAPTSSTPIPTSPTDDDGVPPPLIASPPPPKIPKMDDDETAVATVVVDERSKENEGSPAATVVPMETPENDVERTTEKAENVGHDDDDGEKEKSNHLSEQQQNIQRKKPADVVFIRGEQVQYLYEILRGKDSNYHASSLANKNVVFSSDPLCDEYIDFVARTGRPIFEWTVLRSFFVTRIETRLWEMTQTGAFDHLPNVPNTDRSSSRQYIERILSASRSLPGVPFTIQRICELLLQPKKHYKRADKFYRALEKNISVVTTVDRDGRRETERQPEPELFENENEHNDEQENIDDQQSENSATVVVNNLTSENSFYNHAPPQ